VPPIADLHDSLQDLSELIDRRLVITDERLRVVAYSIHESDTDRARLSVILAHSDTWPVPPASAGHRTVDISGFGRVLVTPLRDHRHRVGFLLLVLERDEAALPPALAATVAEHAGELGLMLSLRTLYAERDRHRVQSLLEDLIGGDSGARAAAASALVDDGLLGASRQYSAVALGSDPRHPAYDAAAGGLTRLAGEATIVCGGRAATASVAGAVLRSGLGVLVFPRPVVADRLARIFDRPEYASIRAGLGPLVTDLTVVAESFRRARDAWQVGCATESPARVLAWSHLGLERLLVRLPLDALVVDDFPAPVHDVLIAGFGAESMATLEAYLSHGGDAAATARDLHVHRSTLYYRLDRIRSAAGVDLADGEVRWELQTGLRIARLAGIISDTVSDK
jgi:hypothetical protein